MKLTVLFIFISIVALGQSADKVAFNEAVNEYRRGSFKEAQQKFETAIKENPANARSYYNAGNAAFLSGDIETAKTYYNHYCENATSSTEKSKGYYNLGNVHLQEGLMAESNPQAAGNAINHFKNAVSAYKECLKQDPTDAQAKYNLTYALNKLNQLQKEQQKEQQNQENQKNKDNSENQDNKENQDDSSDSKNEENKSKEKESPENQKPNEKEKENSKDGDQKPEDKEDKPAQPVTKTEAEKELDKLNAEERKVLQKVSGTKASRSKDASLKKDW